MKLAEFTSPAKAGYTSFAFSGEDQRARTHATRLMEREANLAVRIDAAGDLIGRREGRKQGPTLLMGSHVDTVRGGGRFDGMGGVIAAIEVVRRTRRGDASPPDVQRGRGQGEDIDSCPVKGPL